jgi:hypothetical protein
MSREKKITKFSIGRFTNGACVLFGIILKGNVYGFVINKSHWNNFPLFSFVSTPEFYSENDKYPHFLRKLNRLSRFFLILKDKWAINRLVDCLDELSDIPMCAWKYKDFVNTGSREVLFEKQGIRREILKHFESLNDGAEFDIINIVINKYDKKIAKEFFNYKPTYTVYIWNTNDRYCPVHIPTFYNKTIYVVFDWIDILEPLFEKFVIIAQKEKGVDKEFEYLREKIK